MFTSPPPPLKKERKKNILKIDCSDFIHVSYMGAPLP